MKPKLIGILLLAVVVLAAGGYSFYRENGRVTVLRGYLGGEKTGLFEDEEAARILERKYHIQFDYSRAGSLDMVTADQEGMNYLFPSSQTALSYYEDVHGQPLQEEIIFNTPIVCYPLLTAPQALLPPLLQDFPLFYCLRLVSLCPPASWETHIHTPSQTAPHGRPSHPK